MYRNHMQQQCNCKNHIQNREEIADIFSKTCADVSNSSGNMYNECDCGFDEERLFPSNPMFGQSYVPWQIMNKTFTPEVGLRMGTIFPELVFPYVPGQSQEEKEFLMNANSIGKGCNA